MQKEKILKKHTKNNYVLKHNFNYGTGTNNEDSIINKIELRNKQDVCNYIKDVILSTITNAKIKNKVVYNMIDEPNTKITIKAI